MQFNFHRDKCSGKRKDQGGELFENSVNLRDDVKEFVEKWNSYIWLPKILGTDRQARMIRQAMLRPFFKNNWRESFAIMSKCRFLLYKMRPPLRIDWYLEPDNFDKIMEGLYLDDKDKKPTIESTTKASINEQGEEVIE